MNRVSGSAERNSSASSTTSPEDNATVLHKNFSVKKIYAYILEKTNNGVSLKDIAQEAVIT